MCFLGDLISVCRREWDYVERGLKMLTSIHISLKIQADVARIRYESSIAHPAHSEVAP